METKKVKKMVPAIIDQMMMWMIIFVGFVVLLFLVVDYSMVMKIKGNIDLMSEYSARMVSLGNTNDDIATKLNSMKLSYFSDIAGGDISCDTPVDSNAYQVIFNITGLYTDTNILDPQNSIISRRVVFNEIDSNTIECYLTLTKQ